MNELQKQEWNFFLKVFRNSLVLGIFYFASIWVTIDKLCFSDIKPVVIFIMIYMCGELANRYGITLRLPENKKGSKTLIF